MAFSEVYGALQQGVVDGQENTWSNIYGKKFFEVQDGITETNHGIIDYLVVTSVSIGWTAWTRRCAISSLTILGEVTAKPATAEAFAKVNEAKPKQSIVDAGGTIRQPDRRTASGLGRRTMKPVWAQVCRRCRAGHDRRRTVDQRRSVIQNLAGERG